MSKVYGLFVGIDKYQSPTLATLYGCVADISHIEALFQERLGGSLELLALHDGDATRARIIDGFRSHLRRAGKDDVALFYYCGHGSWEKAPPEWEKLGYYNQCLVPVDARLGETATTPPVYDIADKELSVLIGEVAASGAQVVVLTDSCHSTGNTRGGQEVGFARSTTPATTRPRTLDDYLPEARALFAPERVAEQGPPEPKHVAFAACQPHEEAIEVPLQPTSPPRRGVFSKSFEAALRALGPSATYIDIINTVKTKVSLAVGSIQVPSLILSGGASGDDLFLGGKAGRADLTITQEGGQWWLSAGAVHGIPSPAQGRTEVAVYPRGAFDSGAAAVTPVGTAVVEEVLADRARLTLSAPLEGSNFIGAITRLGTPPALHLVIAPAAGAEAAARRVRESVAGSSPLFDVVDRAGEVPAVTLVVSNDSGTGEAAGNATAGGPATAGYSVQINGPDGTPLPGLRYAVDDAGLRRLAADCTHLAKWYGLRDREPKGSRLNGKVRIELVRRGRGEKTVPNDRAPLPVVDGVVPLPYDGAEAPRILVWMTNDAKERLYVALFNLTDEFKARKGFADWLEPGQAMVADGGAFLNMSIPAWHTGAAFTEYFKVIASITPFDADLHVLPVLLGRPAMRGEPEQPEPPAPTAEGADAFWGTSILKVLTTR